MAKKDEPGTLYVEVPEGVECVEVMWPDGEMDTLTIDGGREEEDNDDEEEDAATG